MPKFKVYSTVTIEAMNETSARQYLMQRLFGPDCLTDFTIDNVEHIMSPLERFSYWQANFRSDVQDKTVENDDANQFILVEYMDAAFAAHDAGVITMLELREVWLEVKKWWNF